VNQQCGPPHNGRRKRGGGAPTSQGVQKHPLHVICCQHLLLLLLFTVCGAVVRRAVGYSSGWCLCVECEALQGEACTLATVTGSINCVGQPCVLASMQSEHAL